MNTDTTMALLQGMLAIAVPGEVERMQRLPYDEVLAVAAESAQYIAEHGDIILYRGKKPGETGKAFAALARGVAALSFSPGGVTVFGEHFEATHPESTR